MNMQRYFFDEQASANCRIARGFHLSLVGLTDSYLGVSVCARALEHKPGIYTQYYRTDSRLMPSFGLNICAHSMTRLQITANHRLTYGLSGYECQIHRRACVNRCRRIEFSSDRLDTRWSLNCYLFISSKEIA